MLGAPCCTENQTMWSRSQNIKTLPKPTILTLTSLSTPTYYFSLTAPVRLCVKEEANIKKLQAKKNIMHSLSTWIGLFDFNIAAPDSTMWSDSYIQKRYSEQNLNEKFS